jgi:hypothetical protein
MRRDRTDWLIFFLYLYALFALFCALTAFLYFAFAFFCFRQPTLFLLKAALPAVLNPLLQYLNCAGLYEYRLPVLSDFRPILHLGPMVHFRLLTLFVLAIVYL